MIGAPTAAPTALTQDGHLGLGEAIVLGIVALVTVAYGIDVLTVKRTVSATINMIGIVISLTALYIASGPSFMGIIQVVVYADAVMTLVLFVIMLVGVGGDEPVSAAGTIMRRSILILPGLGLAGALTAVVRRSILPKPTGLKDNAKVVPDLLAVTPYHDHVVTMELITILLIIAAVGALALTHRQRIRVRFSQRAVTAGKMRDHAAKGVRPDQKPMPGVYASTNSAAAPTLDAQGETVEESIPRVLRARGQGLELSDISPEVGLTQRLGTIVPHLVGTGQTGWTGGPRSARRSGMPSIPGVVVLTVRQPVLSDDGAADSAAPEQKEEG